MLRYDVIEPFAVSRSLGLIRWISRVILASSPCWLFILFSLSLSPSLCFSVYYVWFFNNKKIFHANFMREIFKIKSYLKDRRQKFFKTKINTTTKFLQKFGKKAHSRIVSQTNLEDAKSLHLHTCRCSCTLSLARSKASGFDKSKWSNISDVLLCSNSVKNKFTILVETLATVNNPFAFLLRI